MKKLCDTLLHKPTLWLWRLVATGQGIVQKGIKIAAACGERGYVLFQWGEVLILDRESELTLLSKSNKERAILSVQETGFRKMA